MSAALATVLRLRTLAVEAARQDLLLRLEQEAVAAQGERLVLEEIRAETAGATSTDAPDVDVEAFAAWLPHANSRLGRARAWRCDAEAACNVARAAVAAAQTARAAVEGLIAERDRAARLLAARAEQAQIDESAQRRQPPRR